MMMMIKPSSDNQMSDDKDDSFGNSLNPFQTWSTHEVPIIIIIIIIMIIIIFIMIIESSS